MHNRLSNNLSRLYIAEKRGKKLITFNNSDYNLDLLNFLWRDGFIYGYKKIGDNAVDVFLKPFNSVGFFSKIVFLKKNRVALPELKQLLRTNKNYYYLIWTSRGIMSGKYCVSKNMGGFLIAYF